MSTAITILRWIERMRRPLPIPNALRSSIVKRSILDTVCWDGTNDERAEPVLAALRWEPQVFEAQSCLENDSRGYVPIEFPSPDIGLGRTVLRWYPSQKGMRHAETPACLLLHETGSTMIAGSSLARGLAKQGIHAFLLVASGYGERSERTPQNILDWFRGTVREARRARDVIASLPGIDRRSISLAGVSLGGFMASVTGAIDTVFDHVFLILCGVDLYGILNSGNADAREWLDRLHTLGMSDREIKWQSQLIEPDHVVHRLNAAKTHLFSARYDRVVRSRYSDLLASRIGLHANNHHRMYCSHYSSVVYLPWLIDKIAEHLWAATCTSS